MVSCTYVVVVLVSLSFFNCCSAQLNLETLHGELNKVYTFNTTNFALQQAVEYYFANETNIIGDWKSAKLRIEVEILEELTDDSCPLLVAVQEGKDVLSWVLPHTSAYDATYSQTYYSGARTLCIDPGENLRAVIVVFSTCSRESVKYSVQLKHEEDFVKIIGEGEKIHIHVTPAAPQYFRFDFPDNIDTAIVKMESPTNRCMILSIQKPKCPIFDLESNIQYTGFWQTTTRKAAITIQKKEFEEFGNSFILVFVVTNSDEGCEHIGGYNSNSFSRSLMLPDVHNKSVTFTVARALHQNEYVWPTFLPLVSYLPFLFVTVIIFFVSHSYQYHHFDDTSYEIIKSSCPIHSGRCMRQKSDEVDNDLIDYLQRKSKKYVWGMVTIAVFYCIPVFQLIISYLKVVERTGEHDVCYYNNLCSLPLGPIMDFNHIYSNIGYVILGPVFMLFVRLRQLTVVTNDKHRKPVCFFLRKIVSNLEHGTYQHYGLYYTLGFALFMEGFLSAGYHICPNKSNFQFDTSFMYAMAVLSYIKVYQFRHPLHMSETLVFISLAVVATCVVFGLLTSNVAFRVAVSLGHVVCVLVVQLFLAYDARSKDEDKKEKTLQTLFTLCRELLNLDEDSTYLIRYHPNKTLFWWTLSSNLVLIICTWTVLYGNNFATQVLYVLLFNLAIYVMYYLVMKTVHREWRSLASIQPIIYGILALVFWIPGMYYFMQPLSGWEDSPSESRTKNNYCMLADFYDNHDVWHFLSAGGLFYSFMLFLTMDDMHMGTHQTEIPMF